MTRQSSRRKSFGRYFLKIQVYSVVTILLLVLPRTGFGQKIFTLAGRTGSGPLGDGGSATQASLSLSQSVLVDAMGNYYIADGGNNRIRKVDINGIITTIAGDGTTTYHGDGGPATSAGLNLPDALAFDSKGDIYISDSFHNCVRKITLSTGVISTYAGNGTLGFGGDGGPATSAMLSWPRGIAFDKDDNLYIADNNNYRVRRVLAATGIISTLAGRSAFGFAGDGGPATGSVLTFPSGIAVDADYNVYIADNNNNRVRRIDAVSNTITTIAGNGSNVDQNDDGSPAVNAHVTPTGLALDTAGNLYIADELHHRVRKIEKTTGIITTLAGDGTAGYNGDNIAASGAKLNRPVGVFIAMNNSVFIADAGNNRLRVVAYPLPQLIVFDSIPDVQQDHLPISLQGAASSSLAVVYATSTPTLTKVTGSQADLLKAGRATITASQPGTIFFDPAPDVGRSFCILPLKPSLTSDQEINGDSLSVCKGTTALLSAPEGMDSYLWSDGSSQSTVPVTTDSGYRVTISAGAGCPSVTSDILYSRLIDCTIVVYDAISPNDDGKNDRFFIKGITLAPGASENIVSIFNRWGDEVWRGTNYDNQTVAFEGLSTSNEKLPPGIYFYKVVMPQKEATLTGSLVIKW